MNGVWPDLERKISRKNSSSKRNYISHLHAKFYLLLFLLYSTNNTTLHLGRSYFSYRPRPFTPSPFIISVSSSLSLIISLLLSLSCSLSLALSLMIFLLLSLSPILSLSYSFTRSLSLTHSLTLSISVYLSIFLSFCLSVFPSFRVSVHVDEVARSHQLEREVWDDKRGCFEYR